MLFEIIQDNVDYMFTNGYEDEIGTSDVSICVNPVSYTHLTLPTTPYV